MSLPSQSSNINWYQDQDQNKSKWNKNVSVSLMFSIRISSSSFINQKGPRQVTNTRPLAAVVMLISRGGERRVKQGRRQSWYLFGDLLQSPGDNILQTLIPFSRVWKGIDGKVHPLVQKTCFHHTFVILTLQTQVWSTKFRVSMYLNSYKWYIRKERLGESSKYWQDRSCSSEFNKVHNSNGFIDLV